MDRENLVTCPYNKFHQIRNSRIRYHLIKCAKNHRHVQLWVCPYNATHHIPEEQSSRHLVECPDRRIVDVQKYHEPFPARHGYLANPPFYGSSRKFEPIPTEEDEQEIASQTEQNPPISTTKRHEDLRDRVDHRHSSQEGRRYSSIDSEMVASLGAPSTASSTVESPIYRPLRKPFTQGSPPSVTRRSSLYESNFPERRRSTSSGKRSPSPASTVCSCSPSPVHQARNEEGLPSGLTLEGGRLVPRKRSTSPRVTSRFDGVKRT